MAQISTDMNWLSLVEAAELLDDGQISAAELTRACRQQIDRLDGTLNAFIALNEHTEKDASAADAEISHGNARGPLHGIPIAIKDNVDVAGMPTTAASRVFADRVPKEDAPVVSKLRAAGAIILGKTNLHEFAYGGSGLISAHGPARNPWNPAHITGGSSSGSAAAVAAGMCLAAIGSDTAGSIRLPAALCGVVGFKPTYGRVSCRGVVPLSWSYDHVGPLTRTVRDAAVVLDAIAGYDAQDLASRELPGGEFAAACAEDPGNLRLGIVREYFFDDLEADVAAQVKEAIRLLESLVRDVREVALPPEPDRMYVAAEAFAYHEPMLAEHAAEYDPETLRRIRAGEKMSAAEFARKRLELDRVRRNAGELFHEIDVLVTPTCAIAPPRTDDLLRQPETLRPAELAMLRNTRPFNALGAPTFSVPCGFTAAGLPVGLQLAAAPGAESTVIALAHAYEQAAGWYKRRPEL